MRDYYIAIPHDDYVVHHGVLGQRWGVRRYQNADGTLTAEGRARYGSDATKIGRRNLSEQIGRLKNPKETRKVLAKIDKEVKRTKEYKRAKAYDDLVNATLARLKKEHPDAKAAVFDHEFATGMNDAHRAYSNKRQEISMKYIDELSGATLRDMGYKDTKKSRDFITSIYDEKLYGGRISKARKAEEKQNRRMERSQRFMERMYGSEYANSHSLSDSQKKNSTSSKSTSYKGSLSKEFLNKSNKAMFNNFGYDGKQIDDPDLRDMAIDDILDKSGMKFKNSSERDSARKAVQKSYEDYVDRLKKNR